MSAVRINPNAIANCNTVSVTGSTFNITTPLLNPSTDHIEELRKMANWLTTINFRSDQIDTFAKHTHGTGTWFIESPVFQEWLLKNSGVLWAEGLPGAGKTILSSIVIDHLQRCFASNQDTAIVFAYCRYTDRHSLRDILASFAKQLIEHHPSVLPAVKSFYTDHQMKETRPSGQQLQELVQTLFNSFKKVYIIVDALDEALDDTRFDILKALSTFRASRANLLLTSRPSQLYAHRLPDAVHIQLDAKNRDDIRSFIEQRIDETNIKNLLRNRDSLRQHICTKLGQMSEGMFLVAALQIENLKDNISAAKLRAAADSLPLGLNNLYDCTWERIKEQSEAKVSLASKAIIWLMTAYRALTIEELQHALAVSHEKGGFDEDDVSLADFIISICCGLIAVDAQSGIVRLVHYTAYDFFRNFSSGLWSTPHTFLTTGCIVYLRAFDFSREMELGQDLHIFLKKGVLLDYVYHYWGIHAKACYGEAGLPSAVSAFVAQCEHYPDPDIFSDHRTIFKPCHVAAYYGLVDLVPTTTECRNDLTTSPKYTPLILASSNGHEAFVASLLSQNDIVINAADELGRTALIVASCHGHEAIVNSLISQNDIAINPKDSRGKTALIHASANNHEGVVKLLLSRNDIDTNVQDRWGQTALISASGGGREGIVKLLLSRNEIDINFPDVRGQPALIHASSGGHEGIVKLLLSRSDADINIQDCWGQTALISVCGADHAGIVKFDVNAQSSVDGVGFVPASSGRHEGIANLLLSRNDVNVNLQDFWGKTALIHASSSGHEAIVKLLLSRSDVDINKQDSKGQTALISASHCSHDGIVKLLRERSNISGVF